jgi:predicted HAD superfamily Cof-like phosphohydrolase
MTNEINQVKDFHEKFSIPASDYPDYISPERQKLRIDILQEEVNELAKAMNEDNMVEIADGIVDCIYILFGTAVEYGFHQKLEAMFHEVHRSICQS